LVGDSTTSRYETITFTRRQRLTGEACREHFGTAPDSCLGDLDFENATATASMRVGSGAVSVLYLHGGVITSPASRNRR
jgi:hypothetical protein